MAAQITSLLSSLATHFNCVPFKSDNPNNNDENVDLFSNQHIPRTVKINKETPTNQQGNFISIPPIIIPPEININPTISQSLVTLKPTYLQSFHPIISDIDKQINVNYGSNYSDYPKNIPSYYSDIASVSIQQSPIFWMNNISNENMICHQLNTPFNTPRNNQWDSDFSYSDDSISMYSDQFSECSDDGFVKIDS
eukprot:158282_1